MFFAFTAFFLPIVHVWPLLIKGGIAAFHYSPAIDYEVTNNITEINKRV